MKKSNKKVIAIAVAALVVVVGIVLAVYFMNKPAGTAGSKNITAQVVYVDGTKKDFPISTDEEFLRGALEQEKLIAGNESQYGLFVLTVDGVTADEAKQEWWCVTKGGEQVNTGVDTTPIADGDTFELTLTIGY